MTATIGSKALQDHVERLTSRGPCHRDNPTAVTGALRYVEQCLQSYGHPVDRERYGEAAHEVNLVAGCPGGDLPIIELGAHWDSVAHTPGADDNASGVAGLLEIARTRAGAPT